MEKNGGVPYGQKGVNGGSKSKAGTGLTEVGLDGYCEDGLGQQRNVCGGNMTTSER